MSRDSPLNNNKVGNKSPDSVMENGGNKFDDDGKCVDGTCTPAPTTTKRSVLKIVLQLLVCVICGFIFGLSLEKGRVFEPKAIRYQMVFRKWMMLKMFLAAAAAGQLFLALMSVIPYTKAKFENAVGNFMGVFQDKGLLTSIIGPFILGVGMTISGACPGMVLAQVGAWAPNAVFTLLGTLVGAFLFGIAQPIIVRFTRPKNTYSWHHIAERLRKPFFWFALPMAFMMGLIVFLLEYFIPYIDDLDKGTTGLTTNLFTTLAWPPYAAGILVGLLQVPIVMVADDTLGGSSAYVTIISQWVVTKRLQEMFPYFAKFRSGISNWWQVFYVGSAMLGGLSSALMSDSLASVPGVGALEAFFGGLILLFGARLGAGCTSGHGLSGMALIAWLSIVAVPCMFGGGIITAFLMTAGSSPLDRFVSTTLDV